MSKQRFLHILGTMVSIAAAGFTEYSQTTHATWVVLGAALLTNLSTAFKRKA